MTSWAPKPCGSEPWATRLPPWVVQRELLSHLFFHFWDKFWWKITREENYWWFVCVCLERPPAETTKDKEIPYTRLYHILWFIFFFASKMLELMVTSSSLVPSLLRSGRIIFIDPVSRCWMSSRGWEAIEMALIWSICFLSYRVSLLSASYGRKGMVACFRIKVQMFNKSFMGSLLIFEPTLALGGSRENLMTTGWSLWIGTSLLGSLRCAGFLYPSCCLSPCFGFFSWSWP